MRAAVCATYGGPEVVSPRAVERPTPGDDELLVRVVASTVNRTTATCGEAPAPEAISLQPSRTSSCSCRGAFGASAAISMLSADRTS